MSSRQEEKERRRAERQAKEQAAAAAAARRRRLQSLGGGVLSVAAIVLVVVLVMSGSGGGKGAGAGHTTTPKGGAPIPAPKITDLAAAARAAGCVVHDYPSEGATHVGTPTSVVPVTYKTNPPTSGNHNPTPASDGIYNPGQEPAKEHFVHSLEHGRVEIQYRPGTPAAEIAQLTTLFNEPLKGKTGEPVAAGYKKLLFQNNTGMPYAVAATAWTHLIGCPTFKPAVLDALRDFAVKYVDTAPESAAIPFPE